MVAWRETSDEFYDRDEALGEARTYYGHPEPCDDAFWESVNARPVSGSTTVEGDGPRAADAAASMSPRTEAATGEQPPSLSATAEGLSAGSSPAQRFA